VQPVSVDKKKKKPDLEPEPIKSRFQLKPTIRKEDPLTHPNAFQSYFHEFTVYTEPVDDEDMDQLAIGLERGELPHLTYETTDSDSECSSDSDSDGCLEPGVVYYPVTISPDGMVPDSTSFPGKDRLPPTILKAKAALEDLKKILNPPRKTGRGYIIADIDLYVRTRLEVMQTMLNLYTNPKSCTYDTWGASSSQAAISVGRGRSCAERLCQLNRRFISDRTFLLLNPFGTWKESLLADEDLTNDINIHLMEIGKEISAQKLMAFY
jgi:hypothetical protein